MVPRNTDKDDICQLNVRRRGVTSADAGASGQWISLCDAPATHSERCHQQPTQTLSCEPCVASAPRSEKLPRSPER